MLHPVDKTSLFFTSIPFKYQGILIVTFFLMIWSMALPAGSHATEGSREKQLELRSKAQQEGTVRILVEFTVADLTGLQEASKRFSGPDYTASARNPNGSLSASADAALERAINRSASTLMSALSGFEVTVNRMFSTLPWIALTVDANGLEQLWTHPLVLDIQEDALSALPDTQDAPRNSRASSDEPGWFLDIMNTAEAWNCGATGKGWYLAVLDTGILRSHEMFKDKPVIEHCYAKGDFLSSPGTQCPNGLDEMSGPGAAEHHASRFNHGSHVAGIAAGNNGIDRFGVAKDAGIIAVQVFSYFPSYDEVLSWHSDQIKGLEFIYLNRNTYPIAAVNMSLGDGLYTSSCESDIRRQAVKNLNDVGIAVIIAAGNDRSCDRVSAPSCIPEAFSVNATTSEDTPYAWGNWNDALLDFLAPGVEISSAVAWCDTCYGTKSGTSMATPCLTGAWTILKQRSPESGTDTIADFLMASGQLIENHDYCGSSAAKPRIDIGKAVTENFPCPIPALSREGIIIMVLLLLGASARIMKVNPRRRKK